MSFLKLGLLTVYLTEPFISGFTTGAAIHVFTSQIPSIFGVKTPRGTGKAFKLPRFYLKLVRLIFHNINWISTAIGLISIIVLYFAKYLNERFKAQIRIILPSELVLVRDAFFRKVSSMMISSQVIIATVISHLTNLHKSYGIAVVGEIKRGLPPFISPSLNHIDQLVVPAITTAAVSLSISISMAKMFSRKHGYKVSSNQVCRKYCSGEENKICLA